MLLPDPTIEEHALAMLIAPEFGESGARVEFVPVFAAASPRDSAVDRFWGS